jgi:ABC-type multidrug transport system ATPase subunit
MTSDLLNISAQEFTLGGQNFKFPALNIKRHELVGLIGQNGSGKSILLRQLAGLINTNATVDFTGQRKAFIFSRGGLFQQQTIRENLRLATLFTDLSVSLSDIDTVLTEWNLDSVQHKHPPQLSPQALKISQIARAVLLRPDILFVERPLKGLNMHQADQFVAWVSKHVSEHGSVVYSEESTRIFHPLNPRKIMLDGGNNNLRTIMHNH